jgi:hypothetical protein
MDWIFKWSLAFVLPGLLLLVVALVLSTLRPRWRRRRQPPVIEERLEPGEEKAPPS